MVKWRMKTKYTKHDIEISPIRRKIGKFSLQAYSRHIDLPVSQGIANLYHNVFSKFYDLFTPLIDPAYHKVYRLLVEENIPVGSKVLDLCCGTGNITFATAKRANDVVGLDASWGMLSKAREKVEKMGIRNVKFIYGDVRQRLDFADESFDVVTAVFSVPAKIPLFQDYNEDIMKETHRVLKKRGKLGLLTCWHEISDVYLSGEEYENLLSKTGYKYMEVKNVNNLYTIVSAKK